MIICIKHPQQPDIKVFVPLGLDHRESTWEPLVEDGAFFLDYTSSLRTCHAHVIRAWKKVVQEVALLRILCTHRNFSFEDDGIDDGMIRDRVSALNACVELVDDDLRHLLDTPSDTDYVIYGGERLHLDDMSALPLLEPIGETLIVEVPSLEFRTPDDLFPALVTLAFQRANEMSDTKTVTKRGLTDALLWLIDEGMEASKRAAQEKSQAKAKAKTMAAEAGDVIEDGDDDTQERDPLRSDASTDER